jgi:H+/Cl- antiporter ClcA
MFLVKRALVTTLGLFFIAIALCSGIIAYHLFKTAHLFVTDSVGDLREMQDFSGVPPRWVDIISNFLFYIPSLIAAFIALMLVLVGAAWCWRANRTGGSGIDNKLAKTEKTENKAEMATPNQPLV